MTAPMTTKGEILTGIGGATIASTPAVLKSSELAFYETGTWASLMAVGGACVIVLSIIHLLIRIVKEAPEWDGEERRTDDE